MKEQILRILREAEGGYTSGQYLCEQLGISRQAVWKNIIKLKETGYQIESVPRKGYRLIQTPDKLIAPDIESRLKKDGICNTVLCFDSLDSTNTKAKQLAEEGAQEGALIVADEQTAGKGRRGRNWNSRPGVGIWMSLLLRPRVSPAEVSCITLVAAMAVAKGLQKVCGIDAQIKWPNDIVVDGKKICGILTEMSSEMGYIHYVVVGIGINANTEEFPEEIAFKATSVFLETGKKADRQAMIAAVIDAFDVYYQKYLQTKDMSILIEEYNTMLVNYNKNVKILYGMAETCREEETECGIAKGIDKEGGLLVETEEGLKTVFSGEVSVRGVYGYI